MFAAVFHDMRPELEAQKTALQKNGMRDTLCAGQFSTVSQGQPTEEVERGNNAICLACMPAAVFVHGTRRMLWLIKRRQSLEAEPVVTNSIGYC